MGNSIQMPPSLRQHPSVLAPDEAKQDPISLTPMTEEEQVGTVCVPQIIMWVPMNVCVCAYAPLDAAASGGLVL